jgi:hypothetical protein
MNHNTFIGINQWHILRDVVCKDLISPIIGFTMVPYPILWGGAQSSRLELGLWLNYGRKKWGHE